ncbi:MAG TPA: hypothetical protein VMQ46_10605 [Acidimicrobiia bacterium]|nr:hypothetical protein [Acidimicrobiia bacterium]
MAQQPTVGITDAERPRVVLQPGAAVKWRSAKPGIPEGPGDVPEGGVFGTIGPDPGWGLRILSYYELPDDDPRLRKVVAGLVMARSAALGRAPVPEDIEVALVLCGYGDDPPPALVERRRRWLHATAHETRPGATAVAEMDRHLLVKKPEQVRFALRHSDRS